MSNIILTGGFGNVGQWVLTELVNQGHNVTVFEIKTEKTEKKHDDLSTDLTFETIWGDLTKEEEVKSMIVDKQPDAIVHVAAIIAPTAYIIPDLAYQVNVLGTKYLIESASSVEDFQRFVFVSSYSVHGPRNPNKNLPPLTGDSPVDPRDNYGKHKIAGETMLEESNLDWTVVRLPAVFSLDSDFGSASEFRKFGFLLDPNRYESAIDARDSGLAVANAVTADEAIRRKFDICGDPDEGWTGTAKELIGALMKANGLSPYPDEAYRHADPEVDESWYYEGIVDPTEAQKILQFQRYSFDDYIKQIKKQAGFSRYFVKLFSPIIKWFLLKESKFYGKPVEYHSKPMWETIKEEFDINENELKIFNE